MKRPRHLYALKNAEMAGQLPTYLREAMQARKSFATMVRELSAAGTAVGKTTVYEWCQELPKD